MAVMTDAEKSTWNAAIEAAAKAIERAPVFRKTDSVSQIAANIRSLSLCMKHIRALRK